MSLLEVEGEAKSKILIYICHNDSVRVVQEMDAFRSKEDDPTSPKYEEQEVEGVEVEDLGEEREEEEEAGDGDMEEVEEGDENE